MADEETADEENPHRSDFKSKMTDQEEEKGNLSSEILIKSELLEDLAIENPIGKKNRSAPHEPGQLRSTCRPRSRDPRRCQKHFHQMIGKHKTKNEELEKKEGDLRQRLEMLECSMPAVMVWNIWRKSQGAPIPNIRRVIEKQLQGFAPCAQPCPSTPSQHYDCRVREVEAERKQAQRRADEARALWAAKELALEEQKKKIEEARKTQALHKQRIEELTVQVQELRKARDEEKADEEKADDEKAMDEGSCQTGECGEIRCKQMCLGDVASTTSVKSTDLECLARLQELAEAELCMKRHITELERREETYMRTLQQADEIWSKMEGDTASTMSGLQEQLELKTAANQQLADKVCSLEDAVEKMNKRLANCRNELGKFVDIERVDAIIGSDDDHAGVADKNTLAGVKMEDKDTISKKIAMVDADTMDEKREMIDRDTITDGVPCADSEICGEFDYDSELEGEPCSPDFACNDVVFSPGGMEDTKEMIDKDTITEAIIGTDAIIGSDYDHAEVADKDTLAGVKMKDNDTMSKAVTMVDTDTMDEMRQMIDKDTITDGVPCVDSEICGEFDYDSDLEGEPCGSDFACNDVVFSPNGMEDTEEEEDITTPKIIATPETQETNDEQEGEIKIKDETPSAREVDTGRESDEEYQLAVENLSDDKISLNEREKSEKVQVLEADTPSVIGKLSSNIVRDGEVVEGGDEKEITEIDAAVQYQVKHEQENLSHVLHQQDSSVKDSKGDKIQKDIGGDIIPEGRGGTKEERKLSQVEKDKEREDLGKENVFEVKHSEAIVKDDEEEEVHEEAEGKNLSEGQKIGAVIGEKAKDIRAYEQVLKAEGREAIMDEENETISEGKQIGAVMEEEKAKEIRAYEQVLKAEGRAKIKNEEKETISEGEQIGAAMELEISKEIRTDEQVLKEEGREAIMDEEKETISEGKQIGAILKREKAKEIRPYEQVFNAKDRENIMDEEKETISEGKQIGAVMEKETAKEIRTDEQVSKSEGKEKIIAEEKETISEAKQIGAVMEEEIEKEISTHEQVLKVEGRKKIMNEEEETISDVQQTGAVMKAEQEKEIRDNEQVSKSEGREIKQITLGGNEILSEDKQVGAAIEGEEETIDVIPKQEDGEKMSVTSEKDKLFDEVIIPGETRQVEKDREREKDEERGITGEKLKPQMKPVFSISGNENEEALHADELNLEVPIAGISPAKKLKKEVAIVEDGQISPIEEVEEDIGEEETVEAELDKGLTPTIPQVRKVGKIPNYLAPVLGKEEIPHIPEEEITDSGKDSACSCDPEVIPQKKPKPVSKDRVEILEKHICSCKDKDVSREGTRSRPKLIIIRKIICSRPDEIKLHLQRDETSKIKKRKLSYIKMKDESIATVESIGSQTQKTVYKDQSTSRRNFKKKQDVIVDNNSGKCKKAQTVGSESTMNSSCILSEESVQQVKVLKKYKGPQDSESRCFMCKKDLSSKNNVNLNKDFQASSPKMASQSERMVCCSCQKEEDSKSIIQSKNKSQAQEKSEECPRRRSTVVVEQENISSHISYMKKVSHGKKDQSCLVKIVRSKVEYRERKKCESEPIVKNRKKFGKVLNPESESSGFSQTQSLQTETSKLLNEPSSSCTCVTEKTNSLNGKKSSNKGKQFEGEENLSCHCDSD